MDAVELSCNEQIDASPEAHATQGNVSQMDDAAALLLMLSQPGEDEEKSGPPALSLPQSLQERGYGGGSAAQGKCTATQPTWPFALRPPPATSLLSLAPR